MKNKSKTIRDPIHGDIKIQGVFFDLMEAPEIQRLYDIKQLGFAHLVFPGAHHTRLEHSLGAYYMAYRAADILNLKNEERDLIACSAMLHDIGHGPFSHTLEYLLREQMKVDHVDLTEELIFGKHAIFKLEEKEYINSPSVFDVLNKHNIDHKDIAKIIRGKKEEKHYLSQMMNSTVDVDQLDYLIRDAYYTGVSYGIIDTERFLRTITIENNNLAITRKGIGVVESILMARSLMYSSVYFHKTVRIAELMLSKAIEFYKDSDPFELYKMTDSELINELQQMGKYQKEIGVRLKYRNLFKQSYIRSKQDLNEDQNKIIKKLENNKIRREKEIEFEDKLNIPKGHVIIDIPYKELHLSEPRINQTESIIVDGNKIRNFDEFSTIGTAVKEKSIPEWDIMIMTDEKYRSIVTQNSEKILFN
jgi:hypothetical protein